MIHLCVDSVSGNKNILYFVWRGHFITGNRWPVFRWEAGGQSPSFICCFSNVSVQNNQRVKDQNLSRERCLHHHYQHHLFCPTSLLTPLWLKLLVTCWVQNPMSTSQPLSFLVFSSAFSIPIPPASQTSPLLLLWPPTLLTALCLLLLIFTYLFLWLCQVLVVASSSLTKARTRAPCTDSEES